MGYKVEIGLSNKHVHLSQNDVETLFGKGAELHPTKYLKQPGQYACEEKVDVIGSKGTLKELKVLGPTRNVTQVELSNTDCRTIGIKAPVRESGKLDGTPGCKLVGPAGEVDLPQGVIVALRHIHLNLAQAEEARVKDKDVVKVRVEGERALIFENVLVRASDSYEREMHINTDEGNAAGLGADAFGEIILD